MSDNPVFYLNPQSPADMRTKSAIPVKHLNDQQILASLGEEAGLIILAREWGWDETRVRDDSADLLEAASRFVLNCGVAG